MTTGIKKVQMYQSIMTVKNPNMPRQTVKREPGPKKRSNKNEYNKKKSHS